MKSVTIGEFKRNLPLLLSEVAEGNCIVLQKGRSRKNMAVLMPFRQAASSVRPLGLLSKRGKPVFRDWKMDEDEFLAGR